MTIRCLLLVTLLAPGCSAGYDAQMSAPVTEQGPAEATADFAASTTTDAGGVPGSGAPLPDPGVLGRKIIYTADVDLVVEEFDPIPEQVEGLAKQFGGFVANSNVSGSPGYPRTGQWTLRIPVERYEELLAAIRKLGGEIQRVKVDSQDVTEEFYDVEARIRNKKKTEERLLDLLKDVTGELEDILKVERELSRVREEIERVEGRLRVLKDVTSLTTVNLSVTEVKDYVPEESPTYATRVRRGFHASLAALVSAAQGFSIAVVVLSPWLGVLLVLLIPILLIGRMVWRRHLRVLERRVELVEEPSRPG